MLSGIITLLLLLVFLAGWAWAWSPRRKRDFDAAARLPLDDENHPARPGNEEAPR
jgi:cytochrome c oxidase cbb3-type subunit 4